MKNYFNKINWHIFLLALTSNLLIMMTFYDVFRAREFYIDTKNWIGIGVALLIIFYLLWRHIKKDSFSLSQNSIITLLLATLFFSIVLQKWILEINYFNVNGNVFENPLYNKFEKIAKVNDLNLSFTKKAWVDTTPIDYLHSGLYLEEPKSIDILFIGDSTIAWGFIPKVVEQKTGKKVGIFALESNFLNERTSKFFQKIVKYYLKDNGKVIFCFDNWTKSQDPLSIGKAKKVFKKIETWSDTDFSAYVKKYKQQHLQQLTTTKDKTDVVTSKAPTSNTNGTVPFLLSYSGFQSFTTNLSEELAKNYHLKLKSAKFYLDYLEPIFNPKLHKVKAENQNRDTLHIRWDNNTITLYNPNFVDESIHSSGSSFSPLHNKKIQKNAIAASHITRAQKIYIVPLYTKESSYEESRNIYKSYYKNLGFRVCDLGKLQPINTYYEMQGRPHMGNTGGLMQSLLMVQCFKE